MCSWVCSGGFKLAQQQHPAYVKASTQQRLCACADASSGVSYGPKYYKTWLPRGLPNITNVDILQHQKPENDAANDPEACSRLYDSTLHIIRKRVAEIEAEQKSQKASPKKLALNEE